MASDFLKKKAKKQAEELEKKYGSSAYGGTTWLNDQLGGKESSKDDDIAPVKPNKDEKETRKWFQSGLFADGWQWGDLTKTILGTGKDVRENLYTGVIGVGEKAIDAGAYLVGGAGKLFGADEFADDVGAFIKKDLINEEKVAKTMDNITGGLIANLILSGTNADDVSVLGEKSDSLLQSGGQLAATVGLQMVGVPWFVTSGVTSFGGEVDNALNEGATYGEAGLSAAISAGAEILTEKLFGGSGLGEKGLINLEPLTKGISSKLVKTLADYGVDMLAEGAEEVVSEFAGNLSSALYKEENLGQLLFSEEAVDGYIESFIGGSVLGGGMNVGKVANSIKTGRDYRSELTANEQKVVDKLYNDAVAEESKKGKVTDKRKAEIHEGIVEQMEKGYISTDTIEEILEGDSYKIYSDVRKQETDLADKVKSLTDEYNKLNRKPWRDMTGEEHDRLEELKELLPKAQAELKQSEKLGRSKYVKSGITKRVSEAVKGDRLVESYNEKIRMSQSFIPEYDKYKGTKHEDAAKKTLESAVKAGANNSNRVRDLVEMAAQASADTGLTFEFKSGENIKKDFIARQTAEIAKLEAMERNAEQDQKLQKLKETLAKVESGEVVVNGDISGGNIVLNLDSHKPLNRVVGHEITHSLEPGKGQNTKEYTALKDSLFAYAKTKGIDVDAKIKSLAEQYEGVTDANPEAELVADLVGDFLFTDSKYIQRLSTENRNLFQRLWDEVKYLCKIATAGSQEARELARVQKAFEDAYRGQKNTADGGVKHSIERTKAMSWSEQIDGALYNGNNIRRNDTLIVGQAQDTAVASDIDNKPLAIPQRVLTKASSGKDISHSIKKGKLAKLDEGIKNAPIAIVNPDRNAVVYVTNVKQGGLPIVAAFDLNADFDGDKVHKATSIHLQVDVPSMLKSLPESATVYVQKNELDPVGATNNLRGLAAKIKFIDGTIAQKQKDVKKQYSLSDSDGKQLTKEQSEFFRDSKAVDQDGNLLKVYHTTSNDFTVFDKSKQGEATHDPNTYLGFFFANDAEYLKNFPEFENGKTDAYYLNIKNPIDMTNISKEAFLDVVEVLGGDVQEAADLYDENGGGQLGHLLYEMTGEFDYDEFIYELAPHYDDLMSRGYDGVVDFLNEKVGAKEYIVLDSNQAKLTTNTNPTEDPDIRYSLSEEVTESQNEQGLGREQEVQYSISRDTEFSDKAISMNDSSLRVSKDVMANAKAIRERIAARMNEIKDNGLVGLPEDIEGNTYIANSSYDGTEENTTICPRSLASEAFVDAVSEYLGRPLTVEEQIYISQDLQGRSLTPECTYCYVATDRKAYRAFLGEYVNQRDSVLQKLKENPTADVSRSGELYTEFLNGRKDTNPMYSRFKMWVDSYKTGTPMVEASHLANLSKLMGDINSEFGEELKPQIVDAMKYAQSASWAKKRVNYVAYNGHILKWKQDRINKLNSHYGLRMYSFSDFHPAFVLENMQMITDASVKGLKMLGYTKDTDFVDIFAPSGMNINVSTFGFEMDGNVYENNIIGANWEKAKALRAQYPNVGITFVATNDTLVNWALEQDWIDVVIPYHLVRTGAEVAKAFNYTNYTSESSDVKDTGWKKGDKKYIAPTEHNNDKATYLAALAKNHLKPRFARFLDNPNYMKLVNECRQSASMSKPVQPVFNEEAANEALSKLEANGYYQPIGGSVDRMYEIAAEVADSMIAPTQNSLSYKGDDIAPMGDFDVYGSDFGVVEGDDGFAPVAENAPTDNAKVAQTEATVFPEDIAPVVDEAPPKKFDPWEANGVEKPVSRSTRKELHSNIVENIRSAFFQSGYDFDEVLKKAKNLSTFATVDNTPQRVMEKSLGYKEGQILSDLTVNQVAQNETEKVKWLNSYTDRKNGVLAQISKQYNIKPGSKESAAAQMYAEGFYVSENNEIVQYGDAELAADFPDAQVQSNIKGLAKDPRIRQIYDETLGMINESRARNLYPEIPRLDNYFLHFRAMDDTFSRLGLPFNPNDIKAKDLPTDLNGVTADLKPGQPYFASAKHRMGKRTSFDLLGGLERYLTSAGNQIYHIDDIQTLRALRNYIADTYGQANGLEGLDELSEEEAQERIKQVYDSHLSTFAKFLNEEANIIAGKTALIDRGLEGIIGRRGITFLDSVNKQVGSNMVGYNISSSLTNFLPVVQTFAKTNKADFVKAFGQTVYSKVSGRSDGFAENSPVVIRRKGADRFYRTPWQKLGDPGYALMGAVDGISTELIARTKYNELVRNGMDSQTAHFETDKWVSRIMGDRSMGQMPQLYNSKMLGLVTKFQLEVRNQLDSQFYDTIQEAKVSNEDIQNGLERNAKIAAKVGSTFVQLAVAQHLFGKAFETVAGYNPAFDIIGTIITAFGWDDEEEEPVLDNIEEAFLGLLEDLPYTSTFTGGRIPISNALPIKELFTGKDEYGNEKSRLETLGEAAPYYLLPGGYGQIKKTVQGLGMFSEDHPISGSYTDSGKLRFPVEDTFGNRLKAGIFGQYASANARDYFDNGRSPLAENQIEEFMSSGMKIQDYWGYREGLSGLSKLSEKADYIDSLDLTTEQKNLFINNIADRKEDIDMSTYGDYDDFEEFDYATKNPEKYDFLTKIGVSYKDYASADDDTKDAYDWAFKNPEKFTLSKAVAGDVVTYRKYTGDLYDIKADKDSSGKSITGSRKEKVIDYVNNMDADYGAKIILFKSEYPSDDTYNSDIVDYLNSREDISYEEMVTILKELGFTVDSNGNVSW